MAEAKLTEKEVEDLLKLLSFACNRLDGIALDVIAWMPPEDNQKHHHAVEMLLRAYKSLKRAEAILTQRFGLQAYPSPDNLEQYSTALQRSK